MTKPNVNLINSTMISVNVLSVILFDMHHFANVLVTKQAVVFSVQ